MEVNDSWADFFERGYKMGQERQDKCTACNKSYGEKNCAGCPYFLKEISEGFKMKGQSVKADAGKPQVSLVPSQIVYDIARIREYGNKKYPEGGKDNWKRVEVERYRDAAYRHLLAYIDDPHGVDEESGMPHLWHLACNVAFLCELEKDKFGEKAFEEDISYMD